MPIKLGEIARQLNCQLLGDPEVIITGVSTLEMASASELSFLSNPKYTRQAATTQAAAIITGDALLVPKNKASLVTTNPYLAFAHGLELFTHQFRTFTGVHPTAVIAPTASIGENVSVGPYSFLGERAIIGKNVSISSHCAIYEGVEIGEDCTIHSHSVIRERCRLGNRVILQNGSVIGSDGFGYAKRDDHSWHKIPQTGIVVIEDDVEIGAGSCVDRATIGETRIRRGAKIDNLVQIGHGSSVGEDSLLCAQAGLAGSTTVGSEVILGGQVGAAGHLTIGDRVVATAQTGIPNSVRPDSVISGYPAINNRDWLKAVSIFAQLPKLYKEFLSLKKKIDSIETTSRSEN